MTAADLLKQNVAALVENEGRRICSFVRRVPAQTVQVRHLVVRVDHELYVGRQIGLLFQKLLGMLIEIGWRTRIDEKNIHFLVREVRTGPTLEKLRLQSLFQDVLAGSLKVQTRSFHPPVTYDSRVHLG